MMIAGCGKEKTSSSDSSVSSSDTSSGISVDWTLDYTADDVWNMIQTLANDGNYTLQYDYRGKTFSEYFTTDYAYYEISEMGYVGLADYSDSSQKLFYKYVIGDDGSVELKQALAYMDAETGQYVPIRSRTGTDYMYLFVSGDAEVSKEDLVLYQEGYYSDNRDLITILANLMGYGGSVDLISKITFQIQDQTLKFTFYPTFEEGYEIIDGVSGTFKDIGTTSYEKMENFVSSYRLPEKMISEEMARVFQNKVVSTDVKVTRVWSNKAADELEDKQIDMSSDKAYLSTYYGNASYGKLKYPVRSLYENGADGNAYLTYIDTTNQLRKVNTGVAYEKMFVSPTIYFEPASFRTSEDGNVYKYYGYNARWLTQSLSQYDLGVTESIEITVDNGAISRIVSKTPQYYDSYGNQYYTQAVIDFVATRTIPTFTSLTPSTANEEIANVFSLLDGTTGFKADIITNKNREHRMTITVSDKIFLLEKNGYDMDVGADDNMIKTYTGYEETAQGLVPFKVALTEDDQGNISGVAKASDDTLVGKTLRDAIGFIAEPEVFEKNSAGQIVVRETVDHLGDGVLSGNYGDCIVASSFKLNLDLDGKPLSISYAFMMGEGFFIGEESIEFSEWGTAALPSHIDFSAIGIWNAPTSWKEELTEKDYNETVGVFSEEYVDMIPYLFRRELYGSWTINNTSVPGYSYLHLFSMKHLCSYTFDSDYYPNYALAYAEYLETLGYVRSNNNPWGLEAYTKGDVHIRITYNSEQVDLFVFDKLPG